jgi:glycine cleavage system transcriptional repressor
MKTYVVLTAIGPDRPGIVDVVSKFLFDHGCNLEDSRMAILGGEFALIVLVSGQPDAIVKVRADFPQTASKIGLTGAAKDTPGPDARKDKGFVPFQVRAVGLDHPGIVHQIAHALHRMGANIESLETQAASAPFTGAAMFTLAMRVAVPPQLSLAELRTKLQAVCDEVNVDVTIQPA